jgi:two-component system, NarL family, nitrate/nitrite response regulator NarL
MLAHVVKGNSAAVIAQQLGVTEAVAKDRLQSLLRKLKVENRTQATIWAVSNLPELFV